MQDQTITQSLTPACIDDIVPHSELWIENTLVAISAVTGLLVVLAHGRKPEVKQATSAVAPTGNKRGPKPKPRPNATPAQNAEGAGSVAIQ